MNVCNWIGKLPKENTHDIYRKKSTNQYCALERLLETHAH